MVKAGENLLLTDFLPIRAAGKIVSSWPVRLDETLPKLVESRK
jgi:hypothetical protein